MTELGPTVVNEFLFHTTVFIMSAEHINIKVWVLYFFSLMDYSVNVLLSEMNPDELLYLSLTVYLGYL